MGRKRWRHVPLTPAATLRVINLRFLQEWNKGESNYLPFPLDVGSLYFFLSLFIPRVSGLLSPGSCEGGSHCRG